MRALFGLLPAVFLLLSAQPTCAAQNTWDYAVQLSAQVQTSPPAIVLNWPQDTDNPPASYQVFRKTAGETSWGAGVLLPGTATSYPDREVRIATPYEYQIVKQTKAYTGYGYIYSGINVPITEERGTLLLLVDKTYASHLDRELAQLEEDLTGDGWLVRRFDVRRTDSVVSVKRLIRSQYLAAPSSVHCVFLFGHVPVPYSGDIMPDGHCPDHQGAWPCDGYYADMDGLWTDRSVNETRASDPRNHNVPGDGKFDQNTFPAPLKLMIGRVDLAHLPGRALPGGGATFPSELALLRNYLHKDHKFRTGQLQLPRRAFVGDYFGTHNGEAFAASGWRNLAPLLGASNVTRLSKPGSWIPTLSRTPCLCAYGCGPGTYESIEGLGNFDRFFTGTSAEMVRQDVKAAFVLLYGSWQGDWDSEDDILRAVLALPSCGLASAWSGRPHWFLHHMALGEPIGFSARLTQNNPPDGLYQTEVNTGAAQVHIALMGDPTLRLHYVTPPADLTCTREGSQTTLQWRPSKDSVLGYYVYRARRPAGPFVRLTSSALTNTAYADSCTLGQATYMVRALKLETTPSGTYVNLSQGAFPGASRYTPGLVSRRF